MNKIETILENQIIDSESIYDLLYNLHFFMAIAESEEDIKNNRVMTIEESKERMKKNIANFNYG